VKGYDPLEEVKQAAAERWVAAVNSDGKFGRWRYVKIKQVAVIVPELSAALAEVAQGRAAAPTAMIDRRQRR
jgi:hypothetical protein